MADTRELPGSDRSLASSIPAAAIDAPGRIEVSVYLKPQDQQTAGPEPRSAMRERRTEQHRDDFAALRAFSEDAGLEVTAEEPARRLMKIAGPARLVEAAFGASLRQVEVGGRTFRARSGALSLPADVADRVIAVLGFDQRPIATPKIVPHQEATPPASFLPTEVARLYDFPARDASGQCIAIIELGGGYNDADNAQAFQTMGLAVPPVVAVGVDGGANTPGDDADGEVALDIQVCGGAAPGASLAVYFAPNTTQGFVDAISQAAHDETNKPSVISISWGAPEKEWAADEIAAMTAAIADAATVGVTVFAASGDALATDGETDGALHVDYPASDPGVVGCGGTLLRANGGDVADETVWKSNGGGTGGGVSALFDLPPYQAGAGVPVPEGADGPKRGVPDVAGDADPNSGYRIVLNGEVAVFGGTSAVSPLWSALFALVNAGRDAPVGAAHQLLYASADAFRDIVSGDNQSGDAGYQAGPGWDPCTGLGSPIGGRIVDALDGRQDLPDPS